MQGTRASVTAIRCIGKQENCNSNLMGLVAIAENAWLHGEA